MEKDITLRRFEGKDTEAVIALWNDFKVILGNVPEFFITNKLVISTRGC